MSSSKKHPLMPQPLAYSTTKSLVQLLLRETTRRNALGLLKRKVVRTLNGSKTRSMQSKKDLALTMTMKMTKTRRKKKRRKVILISKKRVRHQRRRS